MRGGVRARVKQGRAAEVSRRVQRIRRRSLHCANPPCEVSAPSLAAATIHGLEDSRALSSGQWSTTRSRMTSNAGRGSMRSLKPPSRIGATESSLTLPGRISLPLTDIDVVGSSLGPSLKDRVPSWVSFSILSDSSTVMWPGRAQTQVSLPVLALTGS